MEITRGMISRAFAAMDTDKGSMHGWDQMYAEVFKNIESVSKLLEIGVLNGKSMGAWRTLFPEAELVGVDVKDRSHTYPSIIQADKNSRFVYIDSARTAIKEEVGEGFDIIIDDGDHRPDWQFQTFLNLTGSWTKCYVIEDIFSIDNEQLLRKRIKSRGYRHLATYTSKKKDAKLQMGGMMRENVPIYALVVYAM